MPPPSDAPVTAGDLLTLEELGHLRRPSTLRGILLVLHAWSVIAAAIALYMLWPSVLTLGVAVLVIAARQLGLMVLMHETHGCCAPGRLNTWVGTARSAPLVMDSRPTRRHHLHTVHATPEAPTGASGPLPLPADASPCSLGDRCGWPALAG